MWRWCLLLTITSLMLLRTACTLHSDNQPVDTGATQVAVATQNADLTATPQISASPSTSVSTTSAVVPHNPPDTCPVTRPLYPPFTPTDPRYSRSAPSPGNFFYGTDSLWTAIPVDGVWSALPLNPEGYTQKVFWWSKKYSVVEEPWPQLSVTGRRLDAPAPPLNISKATNVNGMLVAVDFPTLGCWEITGSYKGTELSFVVWVAS